MNRNSSPFKWRHYAPDVILLCVRWYCRYQLSYRDLEEMMRERGLSVDHTTVWRWVQKYAPEINRRMRPHLKMGGTSYRLDETYVKVGTEWKYLYRAVDSAGNTIEFMLSAKRDVSAAKRFFKKLMRADHRRLPFTIGTDKHASYPEAFATSVKEKVLPFDCKLRRVKYLNNVIEQDHRAISKEVASRSVLPLLPLSRADDRRDRDFAHDEEGAGEKVGRQGRGRAGEVRQEPVRGRRIAEVAKRRLLDSNYFSQHYRVAVPYVRVPDVDRTNHP